jgi:predicted ATPase with chaperone activity
MTQLNLSALAYHHILKLACTIADLTGCEEIRSSGRGLAIQAQVDAQHGVLSYSPAQRIGAGY